ncbi:hypothetical protein GCM10010207_10370 [Streptomyces atratus]|nr:hypothetical protein GCM10010207_10370 [Streptomyces atratus]
MGRVRAAAWGGLVHRPVGGVRRVPDTHKVMHVMYATLLPGGITQSAPGGTGPATFASINAVTCTHADWQGCRAAPSG